MSIASIQASLAIAKERYARMYPKGGMGSELWSDDKTEHNRLIRTLEAAICLCENQAKELAELREKAALPTNVWLIVSKYDGSTVSVHASAKGADDGAISGERIDIFEVNP